MYHGATEHPCRPAHEETWADKGSTTRATMMAECGPQLGPRTRVVTLAVRLSSVLGVSVVCAWGGGRPGGLLALGVRKARWTREHGDASTRQRHVLAAPAKGIISGSRPATCSGAKPVAWCAACSMIHEPIDGVVGRPVGGLVHFEQRSVGTSINREIRGAGGWGTR